MSAKIIQTQNAPAAIGPYSQAVMTGEMLFTSGQLGAHADGTPLADNVTDQAEQACKNVGIILEAAGTDYAHVIKTTCFLSDMSNFAAFNSVYEKYFVSKPARSCVAVKTLPANALCEIEAIAVLPE